MINKQITIDGVDVSKCMFFNKNYKEDDVQIKNFCELQYISCKEFDCANCYFKKWKRKEQENEKLKNILKDIDKKLELALDTEQTDTEESFDLLYEIQDILTEVMEEE